MKRLLTSALALSLLAGTAAMAQPDRHDQRNDQGGYNNNRDHGYNRDDRGNRDHGYDRDRHDNGHHWARGQRLPREYYSDRSHYVDYRTYHLRRPPSGYRWVQTDDNNFAMIAITTGLIAALVAANH